MIIVFFRKVKCSHVGILGVCGSIHADTLLEVVAVFERSIFVSFLHSLHSATRKHLPSSQPWWNLVLFVCLFVCLWNLVSSHSTFGMLAR